LKNQFQILQKGLFPLKEEIARLEPLKNLINPNQNSSFNSLLPVLYPLVNNIRTYWKKDIMENNNWLEFDCQMKELLERKDRSLSTPSPQI